MQAAVLEVACILGLQDVQSVSQNLNEFMYEKDLLFLTSFLNSIKKNPEPYFMGTLIIMLVYSFSCVLLIYGALKYTDTLPVAFQLNVWMVIPFVVLEFLRLCVSLVSLVAGMLVLKKNSMDLGRLMGGCTGGGFFMLLMLYMWTAPLSLAQELFRRRREARAQTKASLQDYDYTNVSGFHNGFSNGYTNGTNRALEAKMWQHTARLTRYPYGSQYPSNYPIYID